MARRRSVILAGALLALVGGQHTAADDLGDQLAVTIQVTVNPVEGSSVTGCSATASVETTKQAWWIAFAQVKPAAEEGWQATDGNVECGTGAFERDPSDTWLETGAPYLIAMVSTSAVLRPPSLTPERVLVLEVSVSFERLSGFLEGGKPAYQNSKETRRFYFSESGEAFLLLFVADRVEAEAFGIRELLLEVAAGRVSEGTAATYGVLRVTSGTKEGTLLLDGGVIGEVVAGAETVLRNVPTGVRIIAVRDAAGRESRKSVRVEADRTLMVDVSASDPTGDDSFYRLEAIGKNEQGYEEFRRGSDGAAVVEVPAGEFLMGNKETEGTPLEHLVYVSDFLIDKMGVTWGQYQGYAEAVGIALPPRDPYWGIHDDHPVVFVTWEDAKAYCEWAGARLPTEAEREKASRGTDQRKYPWGNEEPAPHLGVHRSSWGFEATAPVGTHPAGVSPYGVHDMGGNVWEWCSDWWGRDYFAVSPYRDPKGPASGNAHVLKGGSWDSRPSVLSSSSRNFGYLDYRELDFGFRCAMDAPTDTP